MCIGHMEVKDSLVEPVLSFHRYVSSEGQIQDFRLVQQAFLFNDPSWLSPVSIFDMVIKVEN